MKSDGTNNYGKDPQGGYPKRPQYFAMKFLRTLFVSGATQAIGTDVAALLIYVVTVEDQKRYRDPANFWGEQLQGTLGWSDKKLKRVRDEAQREGWLHYRLRAIGRRKRPALYWVDVPPRYRDLAGDFEIVNFTITSAVYHRQNGDYTADHKCDHNDDHNGVLPILDPKDPLVPTNSIGSEDPLELENDLGVFTFPVKGNASTWHLPAAKLAEYREAFPDVDVHRELRRARQWCRDNAAKRKTSRGMPGFLNKWLSRTQDKLAPTRGSRVATHQDAENWAP